MVTYSIISCSYENLFGLLRYLVDLEVINDCSGSAQMSHHSCAETFESLCNDAEREIVDNDNNDDNDYCWFGIDQMNILEASTRGGGDG